ncbi:hypothetical protein Tco_1411692 [Tanacetum coccineum]
MRGQIVDNYKKGLGYNAVPPPLTGNFMPPKPDLSFTGLEEFTNELVSDSNEENVSQSKIEKKTAKPSFVKKDFVKAKQTNKTDRKNAKQVEHNRQNTHIPRGNIRNWNNMMSQRLERQSQMDLQDKGVIDSECSRHMTGNMSYLTYYEEIDGGYVAFEENPKGGKIT